MEVRWDGKGLGEKMPFNQPKVRFFVFTLWCLVVLLGPSGCAWFETQGEMSAEELAAEGMDQFDSGNYKKSIELFENLRDWYPFSKYAILAELKIADAHYRLAQYQEAVFAYEQFANLHPRNEAIPYVIYQMGTCYFEQVDTIDRDQTPARKALDIFNRLIKEYPNDPYAATAREHVRKCLKTLAGHEFYVGVFYFKSKHYQAALSRFKTLLTDYPDVGVHQKALHYIARCEAILADRSDEADAVEVGRDN